MSKYSNQECDPADIQETFSLFDNRGDQKIAANQLGDVLRACGQNPTEQDIIKCGFSNNPEARISYETFLPILQTLTKNYSIPKFEEFEEGFRVFDKEQNGTIGSAELRHVLTSLGERLTDDEVDQLLQNCEDNQGNVNYGELIKMVMQS